MKPSPSRRGIALVAVLLVLLVVAALVAATFVAALQEYRIGRNTILARRAADAAEAGLDAALARWARGGLGRLDSAGWATFSGALEEGTGAYEGSVQRLDGRLFLLRSTGRDRSASSQRTLAAVVELVRATPAFGAALTVAGAVRLGAGARVEGSSADSAAGGCRDAKLSVAGVMLGDTSRLRLEGCASGECVRGSPPVLANPALRSGEVPVVGESGWAGLVGLADSVVDGAAPAAGPSCSIRYAAGDLLAAGHGCGILLVGGNLVLADGARLDGLVIVRGTLITEGEGGTITGAAVAGEAELGRGSAVAMVAYSPCALQRALDLSAPARPLGERWWADLF